MTDHAITTASILQVLPHVLQEDDVTMGLATTIAEELNKLICMMPLLNIYANIDSANEEILNILASDFKVDWWDAAYTLEQKRNTLRENWYVHRTLGTKAAVERAISAIYSEGKIQEWFEYNGKPHHFRVAVQNNGTLRDKWIDDVLKRLSLVTRLSSCLDEISISAKFDERSSQALHIGGTMRAIVNIPIPEMVERRI